MKARIKRNAGGLTVADGGAFCAAEKGVAHPNRPPRMKSPGD